MTAGVKIGEVFVCFDDEPRPRLTAEDVKSRVERRMAKIDSLTPQQRELIHEHGWCLIKTFLDHGITKPKTMKALINAVKACAVDRMYLK